MLNSYIWPLDKTLSGATIQGQSGPGRDGNKGVHYIPQSSCITGASPSYCLVSYPRHLLGESYLSAEIQPPSANSAKYHCCSSTRMALALNNPRRFMCIKQRNQTFFGWLSISIIFLYTTSFSMVNPSNCSIGMNREFFCCKYTTLWEVPVVK